MQNAEIAGHALVITDHGGDGPPVVFSHGTQAGPGAYDQQLTALSDVYRTISWRSRDAVDPGFAADPWEAPRTLFGLLDALGIERAVLCGAGDAALLIIRAALLHPDRVRGLALLHADLPDASGAWGGRVAGDDHPAAADDHLGDRLEELAMPVLLVHGDDDPISPLASAHAVTGVVSDPRGVIEVAGATANVAATHPDLVTDALRDFLEGLPA